MIDLAPAVVQKEKLAIANICQELGFTNDYSNNQTTREKGIILVADDQYMNLEALKINLQEINKIKKAEFYVNGQEIIDRVLEVLTTETTTLVRPIQALLLDFQMPVKNGIQTVQAIKRIYQSINDNEDRNLVEPNYIFLSAHIANLSF